LPASLADGAWAAGAALAAAQAGAGPRAEAPFAGECVLADEAHVGLLQRGHSLDAATAMVHLSPPEDIPMPVSWFHIPKAGSSFAETLLGVEELCGSAGQQFDQTIWLEDIETYCPGIWSPQHCKASSFTAGHRATWSECSEQGYLGDVDRLGLHLMGFFRQPEQRLLSDYSMLCSTGGSLDPSCNQKQNFFKQHQACATKMLTSTSLVVDHCVSHSEPSESDAIAAEDRLMNLFAFVGITEKWDLSICLFNAKYNNPCKSNQFDSSFHVNSTTEAHGWYDTDALDGFVDKYDGRLYDRALQMFEEDLVRFGVSEENCNRCVD